MGDTPLKLQYPLLYNIVQQRHVSVYNVMGNGPPLNLSFRRNLIDDKWEAWSHLCHLLMYVHLLDTPDTFVWKHTSMGVFFVKSMYADLMNGHTRFLHQYIWKLKVPLKIKVFVWFLNRKSGLLRITLLEGNGKDVLNVLSTAYRKWWNTYSSHVLLRKSFGLLYIVHIIFCLQPM